MSDFPIVDTSIKDSIKKARKQAALSRSAKTIKVEGYSRLVSCNLPKSMLIYEHLAHISTACTYASNTTLSKNHKDTARRAIAALTAAFSL